ncbi:hypothetical protein L0337_20225 [candidate division KSB1 bacterium]|nr:hypothetical protein [candidate division KSB1 bacterium]
MIRKRIKLVMIPHSGMFALCSILHRQLHWHDVKRHLSVFHFSVLAFVQTNLTLPSYH